MGSVQYHGRRWWVKVDAKSKWLKTEFTKPSEERRARASLARLQAQLAAGDHAAPGCTLADAVAAYNARCDARTGQQRLWDRSTPRGRLKVFAAYCAKHGAFEPGDVTAKTMRGFVAEIAKDHAARTVLGYYAAARAFLRDAVCEELIERNPCDLLRRGELPKKVDADPEWRDGARFSAVEIATLLECEDIPLLDRAVAGLEALAGLRIGEVSGLCWRHILTDLEPLWGIVVAQSFNRVAGKVKSVKTAVPRKVAVHPVLRALLERWRKAWAVGFKRVPRPDDLVCPAPHGGHLRHTLSRARFAGYLVALGMRDRRQHDLRRTFLSLASDCGCRPDLIEHMSHGRSSRSVADSYRSPAWPTYCAEIAKIQIGAPSAEVRQMRAVAGDRPDHTEITRPGNSAQQKAISVSGAGGGKRVFLGTGKAQTDPNRDIDDVTDAPHRGSPGPLGTSDCDRCDREMVRRAVSALELGQVNNALALLRRALGE